MSNRPNTTTASRTLQCRVRQGRNRWDENAMPEKQSVHADACLRITNVVCESICTASLYGCVCAYEEGCVCVCVCACVCETAHARVWM